MIDCKLLQKNGLLAVAFVSGLAICASGRAAQEQTFDWQATNDQSVRLDPSGYHTGQVFKSSVIGLGTCTSISRRKSR